MRHTNRGELNGVRVGYHMGHRLYGVCGKDSIDHLDTQRARRIGHRVDGSTSTRGSHFRKASRTCPSAIKDVVAGVSGRNSSWTRQPKSGSI